MRYLLIFLCLFGTQAKQINPMEIEFYTVDELERFNPDDPIPKIKLSPLKRRKDNFKPEKFIAILKKGALITDLEADTYHITDKKSYVIAEEQIIGSGKAYLWGKSGKTNYLTSMTNLISIQNDLDLLPRPQEYRIYPPRNRLLSSDKKLCLNNSIKYQQEVISIGMMADILSIEPVIATGQRLVLSSFYKSNLPLQFGLNLNYQMASWNSISSWHTLAAGAQLRYTLYQKKKNNLYLIVGYEQTIFFSLASSLDSISLSGGSFLAELSYTFPTKFGTFLLGFSLRFMEAQVETQGYSNLASNRKGINSYALSLGYNFDWGI